MKLASILSEVWRNVLSGTARVPLFATLIAIIAGLAAGAEVATVHGIQADAYAYVNGGGATRYIAAENSIVTAACESLTAYQSVDASGAFRQVADITIDALPGSKFQAYEVTPGFAALLGMTANVDGIWISNSLSASFGVSVGSALKSGGETVRVAGVFDYPDDGRDSRLGYAVLVPVLAYAGHFDECWMRSWPQSSESEGLLRSTLSFASSEGTEMAISQLNKSLGADFDGHAMFESRLSRWAPLVSTGAGVLLGLSWTRRRKLEYAASLHAGQSRAAMSAGVVIETLVWSVLGTALAGVAAWAGTAVLFPQALIWAPGLIASPLLSASVGAVLGALMGAFLVREADLFRYFKDR